MHKSKLLMGIALLMIIICICLTYTHRSEWWCFIDIFCFFMSAFLQLMSLVLGKALVAAGKKLTFCAGAFGVLGVIALIGEAIAWYYIF